MKTTIVGYIGVQGLELQIIWAWVLSCEEVQFSVDVRGTWRRYMRLFLSAARLQTVHGIAAQIA